MTYVNFKTPSKTGDFNNLIENLFTPLPSLFRDDFQSPNLISSVAVNINESENGYDLELVAPGFTKEDFKIDLAKKILTISAEKNIEENKDKKQIRREYKYKSFKRSFTVDENIDSENISAQYINGVLILNFPKKQEVKPPAKQITIN